MTLRLGSDPDRDDHRGDGSVEHVRDPIDSGGRTVCMTDVSMIDVLADLRPDVDADILLVRLAGGATHAITIREIVRGAACGLRMERDADGSLRATLLSEWESSWVVESLRTVTFAEFVGAPKWSM